MKKITIIFLSLVSIIVSNSQIIYATETTYNPNYTERKQEMIDLADSAPLYNDKVNKGKGAYGNWTWRDGVIVISDSKALTSLYNNGHAGIVGWSTYYTTVEANPGVPIKLYYGEWHQRDDYGGEKVYHVGVRSTSVWQDHLGATWVELQIGKPYNYDYLDSRRTDRFYCSQLVWSSYYYTSGVNLDTIAYGSGIHPFEILNHSNVVKIFQNK